jgi:hypothetical protein
MKQFKNAKGRADVLLSQHSANRLAGDDNKSILKELNRMEGLTYAEKRQVVRGLKINVEETVRKNLSDRDLQKLKWKKK